MIRTVCRDTMLLAQKASPATADDLPIASDLLDTLNSMRDRCIGMAANMIGQPKRIIAIAIGPMVMVMLNPVISGKRQPFQTEEGCMSLDGVRPVTRYRTIDVVYQDTQFMTHRMTYTGLAAQVIQHECDHLEGILI